MDMDIDIDIKTKEFLRKLEDNDYDFQLEDLKLPGEMKEPKDVLKNLFSFYDEKISELEKKIQETKNKKLTLNNNFLQQDETIAKYLNNPDFIKFAEFNIDEHVNTTNNKIKEMEEEENEAILKVLNKELSELKDEKESLKEPFESLNKIYKNYNSIKEAFDIKKKELKELKINNSTEYDSKIKDIKSRIKNHLNEMDVKLKSISESGKDPNKKYQNLKQEADEYFKELKNKEAKVKKETHSNVKRDYTLIFAAVAVVATVAVGVGVAIGAACSCCSIF